MRILVQKFGGSSVADLECMKKVRSKVLAAHEEGYKVVVVLSARAGQTNALLERAYHWSDEPDLAELDVLLTTGEQESVALFSMLLQDAGVKARSILGFQIPIITDDSFGSARIDSIDATRLRELFETYDVLVMAGFQGRTPDMRLTTLGRGGSDTSAVAIAAALGDETRCDIYTDVDGVYTTDPRIVPNARKLPEITYDEMLELASLGAQVLHNRSVELAKKYRINMEVVSSLERKPGTKIKEVVKMEKTSIAGVAKDTNVACIALVGLDHNPGVAFQVFHLLGTKGINVDIILQSIGDVDSKDISFTVHRKDMADAVAILEDNKDVLKFDHLETDDKVGKVSIVGAGLISSCGMAAKMFEALYGANINIQMISTSEIKISVLLHEEDINKAVKAIHAKFFDEV
jgi:aspartate kinase